jgi:type II secretory pathway predicted ATPase ExeA/cell division septation protein DedD
MPQVACLGGRPAPIDAYDDMSQWKGYSPDNVLPSDAGVADGPETAASAGALTYEPYYGLKAKPFSLSTDPRTLYKSPAYSAALEDLLSGIRRREGIVVLTGEMGTGKTTLCRAALYQLDRKTFTTFVPDPSLSREDLLRMLLVDFGEVSVDDLRRGRLAGASRPDLSYQLYEFLTSLESVDAFAVLVIDEAQHLAQPLIDEIRALSELEAGRRLLQIVLVGQPELQTRLKQFQMRQIDQRVTMRCELRPLTKEDVAGYVAHRLATVGGANERIAFASAAIELIHAASNGVPRLVNIICDRALSHAHLERLSVIGPPVVAGAMDELQLTSGQISVGGQVIERSMVAPVAPELRAVAATAPPPVATAPLAAVATTPPAQQPAQAADRAGLFDRRRAPADSGTTSELHALLDLPTTAARRDDWDEAPEHVRAGASAAPAWKWRVDSEVRRETRFAWLKTAGLAVVGMGVVLIAGGIAVTAQRGRTAAPEQTAAPPPASAVAKPASAPTASTPVTTGGASQRQSAAASTATKSASPAAVAGSGATDTWIVQVGVFSSHERSQIMVERLTESGFPAYEVPTEAGRGLLYHVRVGPFKTATEADEARAELRELEELETAFVRSVTSVP